MPNILGYSGNEELAFIPRGESHWLAQKSKILFQKIFKNL